MIKSLWHFINKTLLSSTAKQRLLLRWDNTVRAFYISTGRTHLIKKKNGSTYLLDMNNLIDLRIVARGEYEAEQQSFFIDQIQQKGCTMFCDIGANWGMYSIKTASLDQVTTVHAFEPDDKNRTQLNANIFLNQLHDKIIIHPCAISSFTGEANFSATDVESDRLQNRGTSKLSDQGEVSVSVKKLDDVITAKNQKIAFKIDIEGNEIEAIVGMRHCLANNSCILQIEAFKDTKDSLEAEMTKKGYKLFHTIGNDYYFSNF
ncbi:MAG: FkbM family methyltransferase [Arenicella sp.]